MNRFLVRASILSAAVVLLSVLAGTAVAQSRGGTDVATAAFAHDAKQVDLFQVQDYSSRSVESAIPAKSPAPDYNWVQGFAERRGSGSATQYWKADRAGNLQTHAEMKKILGTGTGSSESWAEALACKTISAQKGVYRITAVVPLNGTLATERYSIGSSAATAEVYTVIKAWQGAWPGTKGHKFTKLVAQVKTNKDSHKRKDLSVRQAETQVVYYTVTDTRLPLKVCAGQNSHTWVNKYGYAWSEFVKDYSAVPTLQLSIEKLP
jgi:hypothetical protein